MLTKDRFSRPLRNLRISVTDRCNLRCAYCMPEHEYVWLPRSDLLSFEEILELVKVFRGAGVRRLRLTGGEPLLRKDLPRLVAMLAGLGGIDDLAMTTNGALLAEHGRALRDAGLHRVTVSLDTLRPERFRAMAGRDELDRVRAGIEHATGLGLPVKINTVVLRGENDDELTDLVEYGKQVGAEVRFIEYMDVGGATRWDQERVFARQDILKSLAAHYGGIVPKVEGSSAPADRWLLPDGTAFGVIASTTAPFCSACDRSRLTADGHWYLCLYAKEGIDLRRLVRSGASQEELRATITEAWTQRRDRGAEARLGLLDRRPLAQKPELTDNPHLEMHTRGG
ncbi:MAG: GTP 3',8-cyclase MoaA [Planctomycetota bacterium]